MGKYTNYITILLAFLFADSFNTYAQDVVFNHPYAGMLYTNPSYTGIFGDYHAGAAFRSQYTGSAAPYTTYYIETDIFIDRWRSGFGLYLLNDRAAGGQLVQTGLGLSYMFALQINEELEFRPALQAVYHNRRKDFQTLTFPDGIDITGMPSPISPEAYEPYTFNTIDFSAGLLMRYQQLEAGASIQHLGAQQPVNSPVGTDSAGSALKFTLHAKYVWNLGKETGTEISPADWADFSAFSLAPYILYSQELEYKYINAGILLQSGALFAGGGIKTALQQQVSNISLSGGFITSNFRIGYSLDFIVAGNSLNGWQGVSHEVFVHFSLRNNHAAPERSNRKKKWRTQSTCGCYL